MSRINFDLQELQAFVAVADWGSFKEAANKIHLSAPALSRRIEKLETHLGTQLFKRTTRSVELTPQGLSFLNVARDTLHALEVAASHIQDVQKSKKGKITIACVASTTLHFLPHAFQKLIDKVPGIQFNILDLPESQVIRNVISGDADLGVGFVKGKIPEIEFEPLFKDPFVVAVHQNHPFAKNKSINWKKLVEEKLMTVSRNSGNRMYIDDAMTQVKLKPQYMLEAVRVSTLLGMVDAQLGVAILPQLAIAGSPHANIMGVVLQRPTVYRQLGILTKHGVTLEPIPSMARTIILESVLSQ